MANEILQKEIVGLSESDINLLVEYARFLKIRPSLKYKSENKGKPIRKIGLMSSAFVSIAPDFDETPDCMKEYV